MARVAQDVTETELSVMQVLWDQGTVTIRQITDVLYPDGRTASYATVQKLLERLEDKGCVARTRSGNVHLFAALVQRHDLIGRRLQSVAEQLCEGSWTPLLTTLVQGEHLSAADRQQLRSLIDDLDRGNSRSGTRR